MSISFVELLKIGLAASAVIAVMAMLAFNRLSQNSEINSRFHEPGFVRFGPWTWSGRQILNAVLLAFAILVVGLYYQFSPKVLLDDYDEYDILHYYLNAKYSDELGYDNLYPAIIIADAETAKRFEGKISKYRNAKNHEYRSYDFALNLAPEIKSKFTKGRWKSFVSDYRYVQSRISTSKWRTILQDRGYNATPIWNLMGRAVGNVVDIKDLKLLCILDVVIMAAMFGAIYWAFGQEALIFGLLFMGISYSFRWPMVGWSVLRYDWLAALVSGAAFLKKERYKTAGFLFGYATCMRIFPAVFMFGLVAKGIHGILTNKTVPWTKPLARIISGVPRHYWTVAGIMLLTIGLASTAAAARDGREAFTRHFHDLSVHLKPENLSSQRCGLGTALVFDNSLGTDDGYIPKDKKLEVGKKVSLKYGIAFVLLVVLGIGATRLKDHEAVLIGFIPFFLLSIASYYYYVMRMTVVTWHAQALEKPRNAIGLVLLFLTEVVTWTAELTSHSRYFAIGWMGGCLIAYTVIMVSLLFKEWWVARKES